MAALLALLALVAALGLSGCSNDNPREDGGTITVDIRGIKQQLGGGSGGFSTSTTGPGDSPATTDVKSLIIGAVVITFTDTPLTSDTNIDSGLEDKLADDVINSINYFSIVDLPTSDDFVEFKVPPPGADHWQVAAIGTRNKIAVFEDLSDESVAIYYGFTPQFYNTSGDSGPTVDIEMKRACFIDDPPAGCAAYGDSYEAVVTSSVEILQVSNQGGNLSLPGSHAYPIKVRDGGATGGNCNGTTPCAPSYVETILQTISGASGATALTVEVSHQQANGQSTACQSATTVGNLRTECGSSTFESTY
jgi:hypothetical protein